MGHNEVTFSHPMDYFESLSGLDKIEQLQNHDNEEIYKLTYEIIDTYFKYAFALQGSRLFIHVVHTVVMFRFQFK